ncbi:MAG TPA: sporulation protein [Thermoleophilaceae bacterium]|jgi:sporulation-control protein spo0M
MSMFGSDTTVQIALSGYDFHPGDSVTARVVVGGGPDDRIQGGRVELAYENRYLAEEREYDHDGPDRTRTVTRSETVVAAWQPLPAGPEGAVAHGEHVVTLTFPHDAPPTAHEPAGFGDVVQWRVRAILDRRMAFDPDAEQIVRVYSRPEQYAAWGQMPVVPKAAECPMGLELSTRSLQPGASLSGELTITPRDSFKGRAVRVQLERRRTDTPDDIDRTETLDGMQLAGATQLDAGQTLRFPFELTVPPGVPPTFNAARNHLHWYVEGIVDRKLRSDFVVEAEIVVYTGNPATGPQPAAPAAAQPAAVGAPAQPAGPAQPAQPAAAPAATAQPGSAPAGWHPDPWLHARLRYWDGNAWTGHTSD